MVIKLGKIPVSKTCALITVVESMVIGEVYIFELTVGFEPSSVKRIVADVFSK